MTSLEFNNLLEKTRRELMSQVEAEQPALLKDNFTQSIKFLPPSATSHKLVAYWLQVYLSQRRNVMSCLHLQ